MTKWSKLFNKYHWIIVPIIIFLITRGLISIGGYIGRVAFLEMVDNSVPWISHPHMLPVDIWDRWDGGFYRGIARGGYVFNPADGSSNVAFFPMYPILIRAVGTFIPDLTIAGMIVSHVLLLGGMIFLYKLAMLEFDNQDTAKKTIFYLSIFPTAFYFGAVYTESTFLLFSVATIYFTRKHKWAWAGIAAMFASTTRVVGILLYIFMMLEWLTVHKDDLHDMLHSNHRFRAIINRQSIGELLLIHLSLLGLLLYMLYLYLQFGDPLAFFHAQSTWGKNVLGFPLSALWRDFSAIFRQNFLKGDTYMWRVSIDAIAGVFVLLLIIPIWRKLNANYALFALLNLLVPITTGSTQSLSRYALSIFPIFFVLAIWGENEYVDMIITVGSLVLLAVLFTVFANWGFVA